MSDLLIYKGVETEEHKPWKIVIHNMGELDDAWRRFDEKFWINRWYSAPAARSNYVINIQGDVARSE